MDRQTGRQTDRQTGRHADRQTDIPRGVYIIYILDKLLEKQ